jgi:hypothetical protein
MASLIAGCWLPLGAGAARAGEVSEAVSALRPLDHAIAPALSSAAVRNRVIALDLGAIAPGPESRSVVEFRLFDDVSFRVERQSVKALEPGRWSWVGSIDGEPMGVAQFVVRDGVASGVLRSPSRGVFRVRFTGEPGVYIAEEIDSANLAPCATGPAESIARPGDGALEPIGLDRSEGRADRGSALTPLDVLVGYTPEARTLAGGTSGMLAEIDLAVASANLAYQNSGVNIELTLALTYLASHNDSGNASLDLFFWRETDDGVMDDVHEQRDDIAADMCALIVGSFNACGIGNLMTTPSVSFEDRAFTVTAFGCAVNNFSFAHELGHNLGCAHDRDNASIGAYSYSFGYRDPIAPADWRTIMAYAPGVRIQYFSNPLLMYLGEDLGVGSGSGAANNAGSMNQTRVFAEDWRDASTRRPISFNLIAPVTGASGVWTGHPFTWQANGPVDSYSLVIATDAGLTDEVYRADGLLTSEHALPGGVLGECSQYYWGVEATLAGNTRSAIAFSRGFTTRYAADLSNNGFIDTADLGGLIGSFESGNTFGDINGDGVTDTADLGILITSFGLTCNP